MHSLVCKNIYFLQKINEEAVVSKNLYYPVSPAATQNCMFSNNPCTCTQTTHSPYIRAMGLRTPRESLFQKPQTFGRGQTFWPEMFWGIWDIFGRTISTHFCTVSPLSMGSICLIQPLFLQKTTPFNPTTKYLLRSGIWIWVLKNLRLNLSVSVVRSRAHARVYSQFKKMFD